MVLQVEPWTKSFQIYHDLCCLEEWRSHLTWPYLSMPFKNSTTLLTHIHICNLFRFTNEQHKSLILKSLQNLGSHSHIITECASMFHQKQVLTSFKTIQWGKQSEICPFISIYIAANHPCFSNFHLKTADLLSPHSNLICLSYYNNFELICMTFVYSSKGLLFKVVLAWSITGVLIFGVWTFEYYFTQRGLFSDGLYRRWDTGRRMAFRQRGNSFWHSSLWTGQGE